MTDHSQTLLYKKINRFTEISADSINKLFEITSTADLKKGKLILKEGTVSTIFEFDKDKLLDLYKVSPEIESFGRKLLEQLLISQEEHSNLFKIYSPTERYHYLLQHNPNFLQRVSLSQLASYLGVTRETLTRIRRKK